MCAVAGAGRPAAPAADDADAKRAPWTRRAAAAAAETAQGTSEASSEQGQETAVQGSLLTLNTRFGLRYLT